MKKKLIDIITVGVMLVMILGAFSGCGSKTTADKNQNEKAAGTMLLSVNPEI